MKIGLVLSSGRQFIDDLKTKNQKLKIFQKKSLFEKIIVSTSGIVSIINNIVDVVCKRTFDKFYEKKGGFSKKKGRF